MAAVDAAAEAAAATRQVTGDEPFELIVIGSGPGGYKAGESLTSPKLDAVPGIYASASKTG